MILIPDRIKDVNISSVHSNKWSNPARKLSKILNKTLKHEVNINKNMWTH